jgi:RimJ/RimL family protein N-acetyltransferase
MIRGESIYLMPVDPENAETFRGWFNDPEVHRWLLSGHIPITKDAELRILEELETSDDAYAYEIHVAKDDRPIGICGLGEVTLVHRTGEIGITIGEKDAQGQGYGGDAIRTLLGFGFGTLGLHRIGISCYEGNERACALYRKLGFTETGRKREIAFFRGAYHDLIVMDMLDREFAEMHGSST